MVYDRFTDEERALLEKAIVEKGLRPLYADTAQKSDHNLHMLRTSGLGAAALTLLGTVPDMERYIARAYENFFWYLDQRLESGQTEGMTYTSYAMEYVARFADALIRVTGNEDFLNHPYVHSVLPEFVAYFSGPGPKGLVNFSDSNIGTEMSTTTMFLLALHRQHGLAAWYLILGTTPSGWGHIIYGGRQMTLQTPTQLGMPPSKAFWDVGWVALRSGWGRQDHLLAFNSSTSRLGHNQYDQNHFVLNVAGEWLITDPGYPDYSPGPKNQVTVHTIGHNALLVNGNGQTAKGSGKLLEFFHAPSFDYTVGEAGAGYLAHGVTGWERKILYSRPDYFVLVDRVQAARPVELELLYQTGSTSRVTIGGASRSIGETVQANTFRFGQGLAAVDALIAAPGGLTLTYDQVKGAEEFGPYVKVAPLEPTDEAVFITLLRPVTGSASRSAETQWPVVTEYGGGDDHDVILMEVPVRDGENGVTEWWLLNPMRRAERVGTTLQDGHVQMVGDHAVLRQRTGTPQYEGAVLAYHLANGTLLTRGSQPLVETERPTTVAVELQDQRVEATVWSQEPGRISLWTDGAASVTVNGTTLNANEWSYDAEKGMVTLTLAAMENHVVVER